MNRNQKSILDVFDNSSCIRNYNGNNIETNIDIQIVISNISISGPNKKSLLKNAYGNIRFTIIIRFSRLNLYRHQDVTIHSDNIDFFMTRMPIAIKNLIAFSDKQLNSEVFADFSKVLVSGHPSFLYNILYTYICKNLCKYMNYFNITIVL